MTRILKVLGIAIFTVFIGLSISAQSFATDKKENRGYRYKLVLPKSDNTEQIIYCDKWLFKDIYIDEFVYNQNKNKYEVKGKEQGLTVIVTGKHLFIYLNGNKESTLSNGGEFGFERPSPSRRPLQIYDYQTKLLLRIMNYGSGFFWNSVPF